MHKYAALTLQAVRAEKKSVAAVDVIPPADYQFMLEENVLDLLYFHAAKRVYLERLVCGGARGGGGLPGQ